MLPDIDFALTTEPKIFLQAMARLGRETCLYNVEEHFDALRQDGFHVVNFRYLKPTPHRELGGQLISRADVPRRIIVKMRAERWQPDPPSREVYCEATRTVIWPLLASYNKARGTRLRLRIEKRAKGFVPTVRTEKLFERFALLANKSSLHPRDWDRFYDLIAEGRQEFPTGELRGKLIASGFAREKAAYLAQIHDHLWRYKYRNRVR
ncbi:MAG: hypothetical protein WDM86_00395 [Rhizomicrobium sp.]